MKTCLLLSILLVIINIKNSCADLCGCKNLRPCYKDMLESLKDKDEEACIEDASIGISTVEVFIKAIKKYCPEYIHIIEDNCSRTYESRHLYEVILNITTKEGDKAEKKKQPVILIDAGQQADRESVGLALFVIEQLVACEENNEMLKQVKWVILPVTNPDGLTYAGINRKSWKKNTRPSEDGLSVGVDISRNFPCQWDACETQDSGFSPDFPGLSACSENETTFIKRVITNYKNHIKLYLSLRRDGHAILYPYSHSKVSALNNGHLIKVAANVASKVNQRAGGVHLFENKTIYERNGKERCGSSVDYAFDLSVPLAYEMRVFIGSENQILSRFQQLPRGYETTLRLGYLSGIRELFNSVINSKNFKKLF